MFEALEEAIRLLLRVPAEPDPPQGAAGTVRIFRAARGFFRYRLLKWVLAQGGTLVGLVVGLIAIKLLPFALGWLAPFEYLAIAGFLLQLPVSFLLIPLDYRFRWYVMTDRSLRIREGLWKVQEKTMTFSNIQNVAIHQGPLQRLFGIADVRVQTAGGGGKESEGKETSSAGALHIGQFRGVADAAEIRDAILAQLRRLRLSGLGDPDESPQAVRRGGWERAAVEAAREVLAETKALAAR